ncbi:MAG: LysR family transcriptional regulator [Coriobacteriales bacterium]|jgi:molybdate transport system regulatory protein|nr:LysR family transcriptional regulator [Coriobacteriales bacterium]
MKRFKKPQVRTWIAFVERGHKASGHGTGHSGSFCKGVAQVLRGIEDHGALMAATKASGMAYSKAWLLLKHTEEDLGVHLIVTDGARGSTLTAEGRMLLETYEQLAQECSAFAERRFDELLEEKRSAARGEAHTNEREKRQSQPRRELGGAQS